MGVSSSESHDLTAFYEMLTASFGVLSQNTGFYPSLDRIVETMLGPLNLGPGGRSYNEPISHLQCTIIPGIHELLPPLHRGLLSDDPPTDEFVQEGHTLEFRREGNDRIPNFEEHVLHSPSTLPLGPRPPDDSGNRCI